MGGVVFADCKSDVRFFLLRARRASSSVSSGFSTSSLRTSNSSSVIFRGAMILPLVIYLPFGGLNLF